MKTGNKEVVEQLSKLAEFIKEDIYSTYSVDFQDTGKARKIIISCDGAGVNWTESHDDFVSRITGEGLGVTDQEKYDCAMQLSRIQSESEFEKSRRCAIDLLENQALMGDEEYRELTAHLLKALIASR